MSYWGHVFPLQASHGSRGAVGEYHASRNGGRIHEGVDITARCGAPLVAVRNGRVREAGYDPVLYGNFVLIHGEGERRSYFYAHMPSPARVRRGEWVFEGERVGSVGETGNAVGTGCHLHFEIHVNGVAVDPTALLARWDRYS
ncbi:MAG TPA: M23 family metallopeptidase [Solirubrobacterales bacterium]|jgi:murein DD-endopeptidase MepM/ murein hydrolase activator NlpD|nr:M23 family metallopeptidase [Solirubrobacterales bacterium]